MTPEQAIEFLRMLITVSLLVSAPILLASVLVGVIISFIQAITSIQEPTLSFAPKLAAVGAVIVIGAPWFIRMLMEFTTYFLNQISTISR
ncbi:MAG: flagellar biosynthetic protein FliQ [Chthoniobacterales bacterium]|nr:flagellar biosynthetic protein FliQ [Chthoniobacterales bacterium]